MCVCVYMCVASDCYCTGFGASTCGSCDTERIYIFIILLAIFKTKIMLTHTHTHTHPEWQKILLFVKQLHSIPAFYTISKISAAISNTAWLSESSTKRLGVHHYASVPLLKQNMNSDAGNISTLLDCVKLHLF